LFNFDAFGSWLGIQMWNIQSMLCTVLRLYWLNEKTLNFSFSVLSVLICVAKHYITEQWHNAITL